MHTIEWNKRWAKGLKRFTDHKKAGNYYGDQWGAPDVTGLRQLPHWIRLMIQHRVWPVNLSDVVRYYIEPYVTPQSVVLEIGPGGGRWTKYLLDAKEIIVVELNPEFFSYLQERFKDCLSKFRFYHTSGYELDGIEANSVDVIFTFVTFVHIEPDGIYSYLGHINRVLKPSAIAIIQYSDKTKIRARVNRGFSNMNSDKMVDFVSEYGFRLIDHNTRLLCNSNIAIIQKCQ